MNDFIIKGDVFFSKNKNESCSVSDGFIVCVNGKSAGVFGEIPERYKNLPVHDYSGKLIIPGLCDLHIHAPQYTFRGSGMDYELLEWLDRYTFPEEIKYSDTEYAENTYSIFVESLKKGATTRACIFATIHIESTVLLMELLEKTGLCCYVGLVGMDRGAPEELCIDAEKTRNNTIKWLEKYAFSFKNIKPVLTPRFIPCCSERLMQILSDIQKKYNLPLQSHLSENPAEAELVKELCPSSEFYADAYDMFELFGKNHGNNTFFNTVMAHCVYSDNDEINLIKDNGVFVAHCPTSNINLCSGIAPIRKMLENDVKIGLGTDVAGGHSDSVFRAITDAIAVSKLYSRLIDSSKKPLSFKESFWLATKGGGEFFGKVGSFEQGYEFDAVVLDDSNIRFNSEAGISQRIERFAYLCGDNCSAFAKYVKGVKVY